MEFINSFNVPSTLTINIELKDNGVTKESPLEDEFMVTVIFPSVGCHTLLMKC